VTITERLWSLARSQTPASITHDETEIGDGGERVAPEHKNDVFVAHLSIYQFAVRYAAGRTVFDAGCGTGYGSHHLLTRGNATACDAVDISPKAIAYCRRRFVHPQLSYDVANLANLPAATKKYDLIYSSNALEHVPGVDSAIARLAERLQPNGRFLLAVPPVVTEAHLASNFDNPYHLNNYHPVQWHAKLSRHFEHVEVFHHGPRPGVVLDFASLSHSRWSALDFRFTHVTPDRIAEALRDTLTLVMVASQPRSTVLAADPIEHRFPMTWPIEALWREREAERRKVFLATTRAEYDDAALRKQIYPICELAPPNS
jgi:SAM-dependent methyltransferase